MSPEKLYEYLESPATKMTNVYAHLRANDHLFWTGNYKNLSQFANAIKARKLTATEIATVTKYFENHLTFMINLQNS